ncbi:MAG: M15 family metallopeptidase [Bdellovibrionota bacterium]
MSSRLSWSFPFAVCLFIALTACSKKTSPPEPTDDLSLAPQILDQHQLNCDRINAVYGSCGAKFAYDGRTFTFNAGGVKKSIACSDGRQLGFFDRVDDMDVSSIFLFSYLEGSSPLPEIRMHYDSGRLRVEELLKQIYGHSESAARTQLVKVKILGQTVPFSKSLGAAKALTKVNAELTQLMKADPAVKKFLEPFTSGKEEIYTFFWRVVAGTNRLSAHSFGIGIDLLTNVGPQYWLWDERADHPERAKQGEQAYRNIHFIPKGPPVWNMKVVDVLERNGFIWGGKWNHYDSMHFEYRPELTTTATVSCPPFLPEAEEFMPMADHEIDAYLERIETAVDIRHDH